MESDQLLTREFEAHRRHLRSVAYRMLGSLSEADDAVQEAWLRVNRAGADGVDNLAGWLTTIVGRVCLDMLRTRRSRREEPLGPSVPEPIVGRLDGDDPEHEALLADTVGLALLVVLETLSPAERLAFVLHDLFGVPFDDIAPIVGRTSTATRQLASRARRRVQGEVPPADGDPRRAQEVAEAFLAAARQGDFDGLVAVLAPDAVMRIDTGVLTGPGASRVLRGAQEIAREATIFGRGEAGFARPALVNGGPGFAVVRDGRVFSVAGFTVAGGRVAEIDLLVDPVRLAGVDPGVLGDGDSSDAPAGPMH